MMKKINPIILVLIFASLQACTIFSLHPLYEESDLLEEPAIKGIWKDIEDGDEFISFEPLKDKRYLFRYMEGREDNGRSTLKTHGMPFEFPHVMDTVSFEAGLLKIGDHYFLDLYPHFEGDRDEGYYLFRNFVPAHSFLKIVWDDDELTLYLFDADRMKKLFEQNRIRIKHEIVNQDYIVITASTRDLQQFIRKYADEAGAFDEPEIFRKVQQ